MPAHDGQNAGRRGPLIALGIVVALLVVGLILTHELYSGGKLEDCLMSGRTNCAPIQAPNR